VRTKKGTVDRTKSATFRMPSRVYDALLKEARESNTSMNALVNQVLYSHFFDELPTVRPMLVALPTPVCAEMLSRLSEEDVLQLGKSAAEGVGKSAVLGRYGKITAETVADTIRIMAQRGGYGTFHEMLDDKETITFRHELGHKGSIYLAATIERLFQMAGIRPQIEKTEEAVVVQF
jgi:hypothetical protein